jgi:ABC-type glycerol-3-phosphate transport system substrate-binding protein
MKIKSVLMAPLAAALLLVGCGGGGHDVEVVTDDTTLPPSALESPEAFSRWVANRPANDTSDPLSLVDAMLPTSETDEPIEVN